MIATAFAVAFIVYSCKGKLSEAEHLNLSDTPVQTVDSMFVVQTRNGGVQMRVEADVMERYENDTCSYELFPKGLHAFAYTEGDKLETILHSDNAKHFKSKKNDNEYWSAFGNVVVQNVINQDGHTVLGPGQQGDLHGLLCQDVLKRWLHPGISWHEVGRDGKECKNIQGL